MSNLVRHAEEELKLAGLLDKDSDYEGALGDAVLELIKVFSEQGHSGCSASMTTSLFNKLARFQTICPLTGEDDEWCEVTDAILQNKRNSAVFKDAESGRAYYIDAVTWKTPEGHTYTGSADGMRSRQYIKSFPFMPKDFVINVTEEEIAPDDWEFHIIDMKDMDKVWEYYDKSE